MTQDSFKASGQKRHQRRSKPATTAVYTKRTKCFNSNLIDKKQRNQNLKTATKQPKNNGKKPKPT